MDSSMDDTARLRRLSASGPMTMSLTRNWWAVALRGAFGIVFGAIALLLPGVTLAALVLLFSIYMLADGVFAVVAGVRAARRHERWGLLILEGAIDLAAGALALIAPLATVLAFVFLLAAWSVVSGIALTIATFRLHASHGRWLMTLSGIASIVWGVLLFVWPAAGALVLAWWIGAYALMFGGALLALAIRLRRRSRDIAAPTADPRSASA